MLFLSAASNSREKYSSSPSGFSANSWMCLTCQAHRSRKDELSVTDFTAGNCKNRKFNLSDNMFLPPSTVTCASRSYLSLTGRASPFTLM